MSTGPTGGVTVIPTHLRQYYVRWSTVVSGSLPGVRATTNTPGGLRVRPGSGLQEGGGQHEQSVEKDWRSLRSLVNRTGHGKILTPRTLPLTLDTFRPVRAGGVGRDGVGIRGKPKRLVRERWGERSKDDDPTGPKRPETSYCLCLR